LIAFRVDAAGKRVVRVGPGFLEFHFGDGPVRVTGEEMGKVSLDQGHFSILHKDAKWYRSAGKYRFQYGAMANGKELMGLRWN